MKNQFRIRTLISTILMLAIPLAVMAPEFYKSQRVASRCYMLESSSVGSLPRAHSGDSEFRIRDSGFPDHSPSGIRNLESGIPIGLRPKAALGDVVYPGALETLGRNLSVRNAIGECNGLLTSADPNHIRLVRPASASAPELCLPVNLSDPLTNYHLRCGDRLIAYRKGHNLAAFRLHVSMASENWRSSCAENHQSQPILRVRAILWA